MSHQEISGGLESATRQQEKDLVVDLAPDRILHHVGVNLLIILAVITKLTEETGTKLACFPVGEAKSTLQFIKYIDSFCWQSPTSNHALPSSHEDECPFPGNKTLLKQEDMLQNPVLVKRLIQWLPYVMLLEAFLFALPMAYWHFTVGSVLLGHLKFMRLLLESIYETLKKIPAGIYRKEAYDPNSNSFNCWRKWKKSSEKDIKQQHTTKPPIAGNDTAYDPGDSTRSIASESHTITIDEDQSVSDRPNRTDEREPLVGSQPENIEMQRLGSSGGKSDITTISISNLRKAREEAASPRNNVANVNQNNTENTDYKSSESKDEPEIVSKLTAISTEDNIRDRESISNLEDDKHGDLKTDSVNVEKSSKDEASLDSATEMGGNRATGGTTQNSSSNNSSQKDFDELISKVINPKFTNSWENIKNTNERKSQNLVDEDEGIHKKGMLDRHIFSMLCYENFASMEHQPYLESVEKLSRVDSFENMLQNQFPPTHNTTERASCDKNQASIVLPLKHAILRTYCDEENFDGCFVTKKYQQKSKCTIALGVLIWLSMLAAFRFILLPTLWNDSFLCQVPYHEKYCSICTISGLVDVHAAFFSNWIAVTLHLIISSWNLYIFMGAQNRAVAHFLDDVKPLCCVALAAAHEKEGEKQQGK